MVHRCHSALSEEAVTDLQWVVDMVTPAMEAADMDMEEFLSEEGDTLGEWEADQEDSLWVAVDILEDWEEVTVEFH